MKEYEAENIRNIGIVSHSGDGKTSLCEAILFDTKSVKRLGRVDDKTSHLDYDVDEMARGITINATPTFCEWNKHKINFIDTPGDVNFISDTKAALRMMDAAVLVVSAADGVKVQTDTVWGFLREFQQPCIVFVNKIDRERADLLRTLEGLKEMDEMKPLLLQIPIGAEHEFKGVVDILTRKAFLYPKEETGEFQVTECPAELNDQVEEYRSKLIESIAETSDTLIEKYIEEGTLADAEIESGLKEGVKKRAFTPVLCGSALKNIGMQPLLDKIIELLPSPVDMSPLKGKDPHGAEISRERRTSDPFSAYVFKTVADPYAGKLTLFRVFSGSLSSDSQIYNSTQDVKEKIGQLFLIDGKNNVPVPKVNAGDISALAKLKTTTTGDTLCDENNPIKYPPMAYPNPVISYAIEPKTKGDDEKVSTALSRICEEDPTIKISRDTQTKEFIISGMGQIHIEVTVDRIKRKFGADVLMKTPKVPYKETIKGKTKVQGKYKRQSGGRGQYGDAWLEIEPLPRGAGFEFVDRIVGGVVPRQYIPAVEKGVAGAMEEGILAGYPITDVRVSIYDGSYHSVDSSEMAFKIAGSMGFKKGFMECNPVLLEPIMNVTVVIPEEYMGDVIGDLNSKRGRVMGMDTQGRTQVIKAQVPMAEMLKYMPDLKSLTGGRGTYSMEFSHYDELPAHLAERIIAESKKEKEEEQ
ncbi:elongation factor G [bacterium]|nr:elongation factor G [bacterium]